MGRIREFQKSLLGKRQQPKWMEWFAWVIAFCFIWVEFIPIKEIGDDKGK